MSKYYIAPTRRGRMLKIVEDVRVPISDKLQLLGLRNEAFIVRPRLVARFTNEEEAKEWLEAYSFCESVKAAHEREMQAMREQHEVLRALNQGFDMLRSD